MQHAHRRKVQLTVVSFCHTVWRVDRGNVQLSISADYSAELSVYEMYVVSFLRNYNVEVLMS